MLGKQIQIKTWGLCTNWFVLVLVKLAWLRGVGGWGGGDVTIPTRECFSLSYVAGQNLLPS